MKKDELKDQELLNDEQVSGGTNRPETKYGGVGDMKKDPA